MGDVILHPLYVEHKAMAAVERALLADAQSVFARNPMEQAIDLGQHYRPTSINPDGTWNYAWFDLERGPDGQLRETEVEVAS